MKIKTDNNAEVSASNQTTNLSDCNVLIGAFNIHGTPYANVPNGVIDKMFCVGDSTLDKDILNSLGYVPQPSSGTVLSDSIFSDRNSTAPYIWNSVASYMLSDNDISFGNAITSHAAYGNTIENQLAVWNADLYKHYYKWIFICLGINNVGTDPLQSIEDTIAAMQNLVNTINADKRHGAKVFLGKMTPCKSGFINAYGETDGEIAYNKWLAFNESIQGRGTTPITGIDAVITSFSDDLNDGNDSLKSIYDLTGDHFHENNTARQNIIAPAVRVPLVKWGYLLV